MGLIRYFVFGDLPGRGLSPRGWRRFVRRQPPLVARWLRWSQTCRELALEQDIRDRFERLPAPATALIVDDPYNSRDFPGPPRSFLRLEPGELTGGAFVPGRGMVALDDPEVQARYPMFHETASDPVYVYTAGGAGRPIRVATSIDPDARVVMLPDDTECPSDRFLVTCVPCGQRFAVSAAVDDSRELARLGHGLGCRGRS